MNEKIRVAGFIKTSVSDGPGIRSVLFLQGCTRRCPGCHNPLSHDPKGGFPITVGDLLDKITVNDENVTFSGGDPLYQPVAPLIELADALHSRGYDIWCYTGFLFENILKNEKQRALLELVDVLVDGPFINELKDESLLFRGSSNQRLKDVKRSLSEDKIVLYL